MSLASEHSLESQYAGSLPSSKPTTTTSTPLSSLVLDKLVTTVSSLVNNEPTTTTTPPPLESNEEHLFRPEAARQQPDNDQIIAILTKTRGSEPAAHEDDTRNMHEVMKSLGKVEAPDVIKELIKNLTEKLGTLNGSDVSGPNTSYTARPISDPPVDDDSISVVFHSDTIILVVSCIVMIALGLLLHRIFSYLTRLRKRRERYHGGLKRFADNMQVVTRTMSMDPNKTFAQDTPKVKLKMTTSLPLKMMDRGTVSPVTEEGTLQETAISFDQPGLADSTNKWEGSHSPSVASLSEIQKQLEARRLSRFQTYFANMDD